MLNAFTDVATLRSATFLDMVDTTHDTALAALITAITGQAKEAINSVVVDAYAHLSQVPVSLQHAVAKQCAYEWRRRKDLGLSSVRFADGSVQKYDVDEWLSSVKTVFDRYREIKI